MPKAAVQVTAAEISRLAGVTRATVSNWRRRHQDFPAPSGGTESSPTYDLDAVRRWLAARDQLPEHSPLDEARGAVRIARDPSGMAALVLAASASSAAELSDLLDQPDRQFLQAAQRLVRATSDRVPGADTITYRADEAASLRAVVRAVQQAGAAETIDVFSGRGPDETGTYRTPEALADLMAGLLSHPGLPYPARVLDPACGTGTLLLASARQGAIELRGQDSATWQAVQAAVRLGVRAPSAAVTVRMGDSIRADAFSGATVDGVLCNPPYGNRDWGQEELAVDQRWEYGLPPKGEPELAWVQHCLAHLEQDGTAVVLLPPAVAERASGRRIRAELVRAGTVRAVVALPAGAAPPLHVGLHLWILQRPVSGTVPAYVLFVDSPSSGDRRAAIDWAALHRTVQDAWHRYTEGDAFEPMPGIARTVPVIELLDETVDLTPARHVRGVPAASEPAEHAAVAEALRVRLHRAAEALATLSGGQPWPPAEAAPLGRFATVADLLRGEALTVLRAPAGKPDAPAPDIQPGDVILPEIIRDGFRIAHVADDSDVGEPLGRGRYLLRADPERFDPWFLAGFLAAEENVNAAAIGTSIVRVDVRRLRVPLLPLAEQRRYGTAFRHLLALQTAARLAGKLTEETIRVLGSGLTAGALTPPDA